MANHMAVVLSQGQSHNPAKRRLEESIVAQLACDTHLDVIVVPHLYDLAPDHPALMTLQGLPGDFIVLSWLYPRAAHWTLDRQQVQGRVGDTSLTADWDERKTKGAQRTQDYRADAQTPRVIDQRPVPARSIYYLDLRAAENPGVFIDEVRRIASALARRAVDVSAGFDRPQRVAAPASGQPARAVAGADQSPARRWYPVIDYSRCTNCMECVDFCLFGVYGVDHQEIILVEQPDNCRKGCPACSRVCPENAIMFPQHKTPLIAGDPSMGGEMKIDLSQLFGKPSELDVAAQERDAHLRMAGRHPTGPKGADSAADTTRTEAPHDELDDLIDQLDQLDL